jgi:hypothetical protein
MFLAAGLPLAAEDAPPPAAPAPDLGAILEQVFARDAKLTFKQRRMVYDLKLTNEKLDRDGKVLESETLNLVMKPGGGGIYESAVASAEKEEQKVREMTPEEKGAAAKARSRMREMNLKKLAPRFNITVKGSETVDGVDCWVLGFTPKPDQPFNSREEKVINHLRGSVWAAKSDGTIVRSHGELAEPVEVAWMVASMKELTFDYGTLALDKGERMPKRFELLYDVDIPFGYIRKRQSSAMSGYKPAPKPEPAAATKAAEETPPPAP